MIPTSKLVSSRLVESATFTWGGPRLRVEHTPDVMAPCWPHLELTVTDPADAPLPMG
jgi:hypothetical protein